MSYIDQITVGSTTYDIQDSTVPSWAKASAAPVLSVNNKTGVVSLSATDVGAYSKPSTGIPASDIASGVIPVAATAAPTMDGTATVGTSTKYAREDHKHPSDTAKINKDAELLTTNSFAPNSMRGPYISKIDNAFYAADKRWSVTATNVASGSVSNLFNGSYENSIFIENGNTSVITIDFSSEPTGYFPGYPYGYIILSFYYVAGPASVSGRVYCNYSTQGVGWHNITFTPLADNTANNIIYKSEHQAYYNISKVEITIVGDTTNSYGKTQLSQIEMHLDRPDSSRTPFLSKYGAETLYYNLTAPGFIGNLTGNASTATKATQDESGNNIKSSYGASLGISGSVLTLKNKNSAALSSVTLPAAPVTSVNNKTGAVVLTASDVGALPTTTSIPAAYTATPAALGTASAGSSPSWARGDHVHAMPTASDVGALPSSTVIPSKVSDLTNDSGFVNASGAAAAAPVQSVNGKMGDVVIDIKDDPQFAALVGFTSTGSSGVTQKDALGTKIMNKINAAKTASQLGFSYDATEDVIHLYLLFALQTSSNKRKFYRIVKYSDQQEPLTLEGGDGITVKEISIPADDQKIQTVRFNIQNPSSRADRKYASVRLAVVVYDDNDNEIERYYGAQYFYAYDDVTGTVSRTIYSNVERGPSDFIIDIGLKNNTNAAMEKYTAYIVSDTLSDGLSPIVATNQPTGFDLVIPDSFFDNAPFGYSIAAILGDFTRIYGPTVYKAEELTKDSVGLGNVANERQYSAENPPPYPVTSVNGSTGAVSISAVPAGGLEGQVLAKSSDGDYAVAWTTIDAGHGLPSGGLMGQILAKSSNDDYSVTWSSIPILTTSVVNENLIFTII